MLQDIPDNMLMERVKEGDAGAMRILVNRHLPKSHAIARRMLHSKQDAEEALQDAFTKIWVHAVRFDPGKASFATWFYHILANACMDTARRRPVAHSSIETLEHPLADTTQLQDENVQQQQESTRIKAAIQSLPEKQRMAVVLCYFEDMTNPQAAAVMRLHVKALEGLLVRARKALRTKLEARSDT